MVVNTTNNRLFKSEIIRKQKEFQAVFASSKIMSSPSFTLRYSVSPRRKIGFIVSHSVAPKAVMRNRIRRHLREIYRTNKIRFVENYAYLFQARKSATTKTFHELKDEVLNLSTKVSN